MGLLRKKKAVILEEKAEFANHIREIWKHENYEKIKEAHNEILGYLNDKSFDYFSVLYLLSMTLGEVFINEYMESHKEEIKAKMDEYMKSHKEEIKER